MGKWERDSFNGKRISWDGRETFLLGEKKSGGREGVKGERISLKHGGVFVEKKRTALAWGLGGKLALWVSHHRRLVIWGKSKQGFGIISKKKKKKTED